MFNFEFLKLNNNKSFNIIMFKKLLHIVSFLITISPTYNSHNLFPISLNLKYIIVC